MKNITLIITVAFALMLTGCKGCCKDGKTEQQTEDNPAGPSEPAPLNISIYLDLSDRITRDLTPSQMERDIAIVNMIVDKFYNRCVEDRIISTKHHIKVVFNPSPDNKDIDNWAKAMEVDMAKLKAPDKKVALKAMKDNFNNALTNIYKETIDERKWVGSDIWGFFSDKKVDDLCMREGYRNILVILTDGYLYDENIKIKEGNAYSYVLPQTLAVDGSSLICRRKGLGDLEVLMLEVNPYNREEKDKMLPVLEDWLTNMEVGNHKIVETGLPSNTAGYIDNFFNE